MITAILTGYLAMGFLLLLIVLNSLNSTGGKDYWGLKLAELNTELGDFISMRGLTGLMAVVLILMCLFAWPYILYKYLKTTDQ